MNARRLVDKQAEDEGLWFVASTMPEAYLQQELRRLHAAVENEKRCDHHSCPLVEYRPGEWCCPIAALHDLVDQFDQVYQANYAPAPTGENGVYHHARRVLATYDRSDSARRAT